MESFKGTLLFYRILLSIVSSPIFTSTAEMPPPFTRVLSFQHPPQEGKDVVILQNLLKRASSVPETNCQGVFDEHTKQAVAEYQKQHNLSRLEQGVFEDITAESVLKELIYDGYKDDGKIPAGYKFKIYVPVHADRNIETTGIVYDANYTVRYKFTVRTHGSLDSEGRTVNQLTRNGNTPTGLVTCDLNTPEPDPRSFGPYPVLRAVKGLKGNVAIGSNPNDTFLSDYRNGILMHTGEWENWDPSKPMPNSNGCLHCHPEDMKKIDDILENELGVKVNDNPFTSKDYKYKAQGLLSIEQID